MLCGKRHATQSNSHIIPKFISSDFLGTKSNKRGFVIDSISGQRQVIQDSPKEDFILCPVHPNPALQWLSPNAGLTIRSFPLHQNPLGQYEQLALEWNVKRTLAKINYRIHTDAVKMHLIPPRILNPKQAGIVYASEADMLNIALFGVTARLWQEMNPTLKGNIRDYASAEHLLVLANLENLNAHFIKEGLSQDERLEKLNEVTIYQMGLLSNPGVTKALKQSGEKQD